MTQTSISASTKNAAVDTDRPLIWVNGTLYPKSQASINVFDHGLLYGDGVFEGIRVYRGRIFKAQQHMDRLFHCANEIFLQIPMTKAEMIAVMRQCIEANNIEDGYIRLVISRGVGTLGLNPFSCPVPGIVCIADQIELFKPEMYEQGMRVVVSNRPKTPTECLDPRVKTLNYLNNILAKCEAINLSRTLGIEKVEDQLLEVIMLNLDGMVAEGSGDNIFFVKDGVLYTPPADAGILEGITRRFVMEKLCPACGITVHEKNFPLSEILDADEVFLTGSAAEMIAVREILEHKDNKITATHTITDGEGPVTAKLRQHFRKIVTSDNVPEN
jgi:branched-chain amino acid aminotransferase